MLPHYCNVCVAVLLVLYFSSRTVDATASLLQLTCRHSFSYYIIRLFLLMSEPCTWFCCRVCINTRCCTLCTYSHVTVDVPTSCFSNSACRHSMDRVFFVLHVLYISLVYHVATLVFCQFSLSARNALCCSW